MQRSQAADAALESTLQLARWVCQPPKGSSLSQHAARQLGSGLVKLLAQIVGSISGAGGTRECLYAAATAAAGQRQVQQFSAGLADVLAAAAKQQSAALAAQPLAAVAQALRLARGGFGRSCTDADTWDSSASSGSSGQDSGALDRSSRPLTMHSVRSQQGLQRVHTRVGVPAAVLALVAGWCDNDELLTYLLQREVGGQLLSTLPAIHVVTADTMPGSGWLPPPSTWPAWSGAVLSETYTC